MALKWRETSSLDIPIENRIQNWYFKPFWSRNLSLPALSNHGVWYINGSRSTCAFQIWDELMCKPHLPITVSQSNPADFVWSYPWCHRQPIESLDFNHAYVIARHVCPLDQSNETARVEHVLLRGGKQRMVAFRERKGCKTWPKYVISSPIWSD